MRLPGPGPQLSSGRLRVDARRAIKKLREYQLADRTAWILEAIRAAVAGKATTIRLDGDANDIWLTWDGPAWPVEILPRLFDELVSPASSGDVQHVRLLAAAVNSALGMNPAHVDVYTVAAGKAHVARYTPDVLEEPTGELDESPLEQVAANATAAPHGVTTGMAIHLRRRLSLEVLGYLVGDPPELALAVQACRDIAVPLHVKGKVLHRETSTDVLRVPLGEGIDGFIAVSRNAGPALEVAEHGVLLATYALKLDTPPEEGRTLPLRVFVDAPRMPTNASRSQVRRDKHPISSAETRARRLLDDVATKLAAMPGPEMEGPRPARGPGADARAAALAWVAAYVGGPRWQVDVATAHPGLRELLKLPLVRNALGEARSLNNQWRAEIHTGRKPYPMELATWLSDMLWLPPGDPAMCLMQGAPIDGRAASRTARWAKRQADAQRKFFAHAKRDARVVTARKPRVRAKLGVDVPTTIVDQQRFAELTGEICVYATGEGGTLVVLLDGRELERVSIKSAIAFDAVVDSPRVKPSDRYRGVQRDGEYKRVERAMLGGVIRAVEAVAAARAGADDLEGVELVDDAGVHADAHLFRRALAMFAELDLKPRGPLAVAPAWESTAGTWVASADLRTVAVGLVEPGASTIAPKNRLVIYADESERALVANLTTKRIVRYDRVAGDRVYGDPKRLAERLAKGRSGALGIVDEGLMGAIAPSSKATIQLQHVGIPVETQPYKPKLLSCAVLVDSDAIVPDTDWRTAVEDDGLFTRNFLRWEAALVRALARALVGEWDPLLIGRPFELRDPLGLALCEALADDAPEQLLGPELLAQLTATPLLQLLGSRDKVSIDAVVKLFPTHIPVLNSEVKPVAGFTPLVAPPVVAQLVNKLTGIRTQDATGEIQRRQKRAVFERRFAEHCAKPTVEVFVGTPERVEVLGSVVRGQVGLAAPTRGIRVYVEQRRFADLGAPEGLPLVAAVELAPDECGEFFNEIPKAVEKKIMKDVLEGAPALIAEIAKNRPHLFLQPGPARQLLDAQLAHLDESTFAILRNAQTFTTINGETTSLEAASQPNGTLSYAAWYEDWLAPGDDEPVHALDAPILRIVDDEPLVKLCCAIAERPLIDVTDEVARLQAHRRMARGLLPTPTVPGVAQELRRKLSALGDKRLGHGELALIDSDKSTVRLHDRGRYVRTTEIDVVPAVALAIEADGNVADRGIVQNLARELVRQILDTPARTTLTPRMRNNLAHAAMTKRLDLKLLGDLPVLETLDGRWLPWSTIREQLELFDNVWVVSERTALRPLDERRIVLIVAADVEPQGFTCLRAAKELELDELARRNRARQPVPSLALPTKHGVMMETELDGDGKTAPRGTVAILMPSITGNRGVWVHREMQPLGVANDPCLWPTVAVIDDARIVPDRTWSGPKHDQTWQAIAKVVRTASEDMLEKFGDPPPDALATLRIDHELGANSKELRRYGKAQLRGIVWLTGLPYDGRSKLHVTHNLGVMTHALDHGVAIAGQLLLFGDDRIDRKVMLEQIGGHVQGELVRALLAKRDGVPRDVLTAHVAHALVLETIKVPEVRGIDFTCFAPRPLEPRALMALFRKNRVDVVRPGDSPTTTTLVDDSSATANALLSFLGRRARRVEPPPQIVVPPPPPAPKKVILAVEPPKPAKPAAAPVRHHPLRDLVRALEFRLVELGVHSYEWTIADTDEPIIAYERGNIIVAGEHPKLRALALANDEMLIDLLVAHVVTVLNLALSEITDATEAHALGVLLASRPSEDPPRSRQSS